MNMNDFHAWVKAGNFDKPREADDSYTARLQEHNKDVRRREEGRSEELGHGAAPEILLASIAMVEVILRLFFRH